MAQYCKEVQEWIEEKIEKPIEEWVRKEEEKCKKKKCKWWCLCCNKWFCWIEVFFVKVIKWVVVTVGKWVVRTVCEIVSFAADILAFVAGLILSIPILGRLLNQIANFFVDLFWRIVGLPDLLLCAFGVRWTKKLRVCIIILRDENGNPTSDMSKLQPAMDKMKDIYKKDVAVDVVFNCIQTVKGPSPASALDVDCNAGAYWNDLWMTGANFEAIANTKCFDGAGRRLSGWASSIIVFVVRSIGSGKRGCSLGPIAGYVTVEGSDPMAMAHEVGHACSLLHLKSDKSNLMCPGCGGTRLKGWQACIIRNSKYVTYL